MKAKVTAFILAVTPNPSHHYKLLQFLKAFRDWTQYVVDEIWSLDHIPSLRELHHRFYRILRNQGFRAHHCHKIERRAKEVVKATKKNNGSKPVLRKLTARLDYQDYKLDLNAEMLRIAILGNEWVELKLEWYSYLERYFKNSWKLKEILVSYRDGDVWVYLTFERVVMLRKPERIMGIDINFYNVTYTIVDMNGKPVSMGTIPFNGLRRALAHRVVAEKIQRKYTKKWRFVKGIREAVRRHGKRARNILTDSCHYISRKIVEIAKEYSVLIALEGLSNLKTRANGSKGFNKKLSLWTYRRIQLFIHYKALIEGLPIAYVDPRNTSKTSPIDGDLEFINYRWARLPNGYIVARDLVASWNLALRGLILLTRDVGLRGSVEAPNVPDGDENPNPMKGKPIQVSKISIISKI